MIRSIRWAGCALALLALFAADTASAQSSDDLLFGRKGWAVEIFGLYGVSPSGRDLDETGLGRLDNNLGPGASFEYRATRLFAFGMTTEGLQRDYIDAIDQVSEFSLWSLTADLRVYLTPGKLQPYLIAGGGIAIGQDVARFGNEETVVGAFRIGGGADFYVTDHWVANMSIEKVFLTGRFSESDYLKIGWGVKYRF